MRQFNLEEYLTNPNRKVITKRGNEVRIVCTNRKNENYPIVALIQDSTGNYEDTYHYTIDGKWVKGENNLSDLFFAPDKKEGWVNIYKNELGTQLGEIYNSKEDAEAMAIKCKTYYITTTKIEWEE